MNELKALSAEEISSGIENLNGWSYHKETSEISKIFTFKGYYKTIAFVNSIAWQAQKHVHHPDLKISFGNCEVRLTTHDVDGLSYKDFELAALIDSLYF